MEFTGKNYWEQGANPKAAVMAMLAAANGQGQGQGQANPNPVTGIGGASIGNFGTIVAGEPKSDPQVVAQAIQQATSPDPNTPPPEDDLSRLVKEVVNQNKDNPGVYPWSRPFDPLETMKRQSAYVPGTSIFKGSDGGPFDKLKNVANEITSGNWLEQFMPSSGDLMGKAANDQVSGLQGIFNDVAQSVIGQANDPMSLYERLRRETPGYSYQGPSAKDMADAQFNPLFQMLDSQSKQDESRYNTAAARAKQSYAGFINDLMGSQKANAATYADAGKAIGASGDAAAKSVTDNTTKSAQALSKELQQLGIAEGADTLFAKNQGNLTQALGALNANRQTATDLNTGLGASTAVSDRGTQDTARQAGLNYQADLYNGYLDQLNQNDQQRLQLQGQRGQAEGDYNMKIQKLIADSSGQQNDSITNIFKAMQDNSFRQQQLELDKDKFGLQVQQSGVNKDPNKNAYRTLQSQAAQYFGNDQDASVAANTLLNALRQAPNATDMGTLLAQIPEEELRKPYMADLAYAFFNSVLNNKGL